MAVAAVLANGDVMADGRPLGGGTLPDLVSRNTSKWSAVDLYTSRYAFLVTLSNGSAILWGDISEYGTLLEKEGCGVEHVNSTSYAFAVTWSDGSVTTWGDPEKGGNGNGEHVQSLISSVQMVRSNRSAFAALTSHSDIVCWGDPTKGGCMEAIPARGVVEIVNTNSAFAALSNDGSVRCWGEPRCGGEAHWSITPNVVIVRATEGAFAALRQDGFVTVWGNPRLGGDITPVRAELYAVQWLVTHSTMIFAGRADHAVFYWGTHTRILTPCFYPGGELGHPKDFTEPRRRQETSSRGLDASVVWSEGAVNLVLESPPRPS